MKRLSVSTMIILVCVSMVSPLSQVKGKGILISSTKPPQPSVTASLSHIEVKTNSLFSIDFELRNIGGPSSTDSFLTVSVSNGLKMDSYSATPLASDLHFDHYNPGALISDCNGSQIPAFEELIDVHGHPYSAGELLTVTIVFKTPAWALAPFIKYRAAMLPEGVTYPTSVHTERDPSEGIEKDQQGYPVRSINVEVAPPKGEWFAQVSTESIDSDGDGNNDCVKIGMNVDTTSGTMTVHVYNYMYENFAAHGSADDDRRRWEITGTNVEWKYSFLYVPIDCAYGNYEVTLHLYDESNNLQDSYTFNVDLYPGQADPQKWFQEVKTSYLVYNNSGPVIGGKWPNAVEVKMNVDTEGGEEDIEVYGYLLDDNGRILDDDGSGGWTIHGTDVEWEELYLWLDAPSSPGYYEIHLDLYDFNKPWKMWDTWDGTVGPLYPTDYASGPVNLTVSAKIVRPPVLGETVSINVTLMNSGTYVIPAGDYSVKVTYWDYFGRGGLDCFWLMVRGLRGLSTAHVQLGPTQDTSPISTISVLNPGDILELPTIVVQVPDLQGPSLILTDTILVEVEGPIVGSDPIRSYCEMQDVHVGLGFQTYYDAVSAVISVVVPETMEPSLETVDVTSEEFVEALQNTQAEFDQMVESYCAGDLASAAKHCAQMLIEITNWVSDMPLADKINFVTNFLSVLWKGGIAIANILVWWFNFKATCFKRGLSLFGISPSVKLGIEAGLILWTDPVNLTIIDPQGRHIGTIIDPQAGTTIVNETPNGYVTEINRTIEAIFLPELIEGQYIIDCTSDTQTEFNLTVEANNQSVLLSSHTFNATIPTGKIVRVEMTIHTENSSFQFWFSEPHVVPEFPSLSILLLFTMLSTLMAAVAYRRRTRR